MCFLKFIAPLALPVSTIASDIITFYNGPGFTGANYSTTWEEKKCTTIPLGYWPESGSIQVSKFEPFGRRTRRTNNMSKVTKSTADSDVFLCTLYQDVNCKQPTLRILQPGSNFSTSSQHSSRTVYLPSRPTLGEARRNEARERNAAANGECFRYVKSGRWSRAIICKRETWS